MELPSTHWMKVREVAAEMVLMHDVGKIGLTLNALDCPWELVSFMLDQMSPANKDKFAAHVNKIVCQVEEEKTADQSQGN